MELKRMALAAALPALVLVAPPAWADSVGRPRPGYWELTNVFNVVITQKKVERRCLVASEINKFMTSPSNRHYACTYPSRDVGGG
jgi:predicted alpha/beta hydrolase family esterase